MIENKSAHDHGGIEKQKQGISSYSKNDTDLIFKELEIKQGDNLLDLGCGSGDYAIRASKIVGESGIIYALDKWEELEPIIKEKIDAENIKNVITIISDINQTLPIKDNSIDICLIVFVLHGIDKTKQFPILIKELHRVIKTNGRMAIIELKKDLASDTHPVDILWTPEEIEGIISKYNFKMSSYVDLESNYLVQFKLIKE